MIPAADVCFVIGSLAVGGAERQVALVAAALRRRGHRVRIYCLAGLGPNAAEPVAAGVEVIGPPISYSRARSLRTAGTLLLALSAAKLLVLLLRDRPQIAHFFLPEAYLIGAFVAGLARVRHLVMSRRSMNYYQRHRPRLAALERRTHGHMAAIIGNSRAVVRQLRDEEGVAPDRLGLIYNGVAFSPYVAPHDRESARAKLGVPTSARVLVMVANLIPYKGHADLLAALALVSRKATADWRLLAVGRDDGIGASLAAETARLGLAERVLWLGERDDVPDLLRASDIAISASHEEGFSNAVLEAMAAGLPMVVTDAGGNAEAVVDGATGLVVPARAPERLAAALLDLIDNPEQAARFGKAGRSRVDSLFAAAAAVGRYEALYSGLAQGLSPSAIAAVAISDLGTRQ